MVTEPSFMKRNARRHKKRKPQLPGKQTNRHFWIFEKMNKTNLTKVVATYELPEIPVISSEVGGLKFVIQILLSVNDGVYRPRVLRWDMYDILPHYYGENALPAFPAMEEILVVETSADWEEMACSSEEEALQRVIEVFKERGLLKD